MDVCCIGTNFHWKFKTPPLKIRLSRVVEMFKIFLYEIYYFSQHRIGKYLTKRLKRVAAEQAARRPPLFDIVWYIRTDSARSFQICKIHVYMHAVSRGSRR